MEFKDIDNVMGKEVAEFLGVEWKEIYRNIKKLEPDFEFRGGANAKISFDMFSKVCAIYGKSLIKDEAGFQLEDIIDIPDLRTINEMSKFDAIFIDPETVKKDLLKSPQNIGEATEIVKKLISKSDEKYKTLFTDSIKRDGDYLHAIFRGYKFAIVPDNFGRALRTKIAPHFDRIYVTNDFTNHFIVFDDKRVLVLYIVQ